jgi:methyl-accepting chemotaxis protein
VINQARQISTNISAAVEQQECSTKKVSCNVSDVAQATRGATEIAERTLKSSVTLTGNAEALQNEVTSFLENLAELRKKHSRQK